MTLRVEPADSERSGFLAHFAGTQEDLLSSLQQSRFTEFELSDGKSYWLNTAAIHSIRIIPEDLSGDAEHVYS